MNRRLRRKAYILFQITKEHKEDSEQMIQFQMAYPESFNKIYRGMKCLYFGAKLRDFRKQQGAEK